MWFEDSLIYHPERFPSWYSPPELTPSEGALWPRVTDVSLTTQDGVALHGWALEPARRTADGDVAVPTQHTLLWFHGNAGNLSYRYEMAALLAVELPIRILIIDYRGYGKSEGRPSEKGLYLDARAAWDYLTGPGGVAPANVVILGKSLGGGPATELATQIQPGGIILQSTFTGIREMAKLVLPLAPGFLVRTRMASLEKVGGLRCPLLVVHGDQDEVIPFSMGERLFAAANEPKRFVRVRGAHHNDVYLVGGQPYLKALREFLALCRDRGE